MPIYIYIFVYTLLLICCFCLPLLWGVGGDEDEENDNASQNGTDCLNNQLVIEVDVGIKAARREDGSEVQARRLSYREEGGVVGWKDFL